MSAKSLVALGRKASDLVRPASQQIVQKRNTVSNRGLAVCVPPREPVGMIEKTLHIVFILSVWITPAFYFLSHIKVWKRKYAKGSA